MEHIRAHVTLDETEFTIDNHNLTVKISRTVEIEEQIIIPQADFIARGYNAEPMDIVTLVGDLDILSEVPTTLDYTKTYVPDDTEPTSKTD